MGSDASLGFGFITRSYQSLLDPRMMSKETSLAMDSNPCDFLLPYIQRSLKMAQSRLLTVEESSFEVAESTENLEANLGTRRALVRSRSSLKAHIERCSNSAEQNHPKSYLCGALEDYNYLIGEYDERLQQQNQLLHYETSKQALEETKESVKQAKAVRT